MNKKHRDQNLRRSSSEDGIINFNHVVCEQLRSSEKKQKVFLLMF